MASDADREFDRARLKSQGRFRSAFEAIFDKYGHIDEDDDIVDLLTGQLIVDNGRIRASAVIELGDLSRYNDTNRTTPSRSVSPDLGQWIHPRPASLSPELFGQQLPLSSIPPPPALSDDDDDAHSSIDLYFTSSIEHYLDKLRHQLTNTIDQPSASDSAASSDYDPAYSLTDPDGFKRRYTLYSYTIPSSPHTMSTLTRSFTDINDYSDNDCISESSHDLTDYDYATTLSLQEPPDFDSDVSTEEPVAYESDVSIEEPIAYESDASIEEPIAYESDASVEEPIGYESDASIEEPIGSKSYTIPSVSLPTILKPLPVAPHVFFDYDHPHPLPPPQSSTHDLHYNDYDSSCSAESPIPAYNCVFPV
ncbi:hypothetical protein GGI04_001470 [Coemansia thaxteri]|uniref:Uncharacterized protein n=1 Tax=Coemansia thaxteri TaxID=2663907 RepID=A0A9W8EJF2_9FUNG|nr:hypothetical protein H4R26_001294 [Coemansia thaxteri]KAJ2007548.1 hypothetical protein GGI04_001470 [Coemansia thaxteri]KAJ2468119.1 hypothetical protein GGI02_003799 [Coemansia sp. RSA 2322]KAJ2485604.1 hypothetical protein EV174_001610 [Coemansia sp. RSA 2320]